MPRLFALGLSSALLALSACAARDTAHGDIAHGDIARKDRAYPPVARAAQDALLGPARWLYVDRLGSFFDEAGPGSSLPGVEPALLDGTRVLLQNGLVQGQARAAERLLGFRSLPARLGGGYVLWSDARTYRAASFLGDLEAITDAGATGGVRPWLRTFFIRTQVGMLEVSPDTLVARRATIPGLSEALALDAQRGVRLDLLGRAELTTSGGERFTDLFRERGRAFGSLRPGPTGDLVLGSPSTGAALRLDPQGALTEERDDGGPSPDDEVRARGIPTLGSFPTTRRSLPGEALAHAVASGALLPARPSLGAPGEPAPWPRLLGVREGGLDVLSGETMLPIVSVPSLFVDERITRCTPWSAPGSAEPSALVACAGEPGALLLSFGGEPTRPRLHHTFPEQGTFLAGPGGRLAFAGRCGPAAPSPGDLGRPAASATPVDDADARGGGPPPPPTESPPAEPPPPDTTPPGDARVCLRAFGHAWIERRLRGPAAARLLRWVPGEGGQAVALLAGKPAEGAASGAGDGVRLVWIDPADPGLRGARLRALPGRQSAPHRLIDEDFWIDPDGAVRGWARLPDEGEAPGEPAPEGAAALPVDARPGGRSAGMRIDPRGTIELFPLPEGATEVVSGGRFALATAPSPGRARFFESTDGGRTWAPIEGPPTGTIDPPSDEGAPFGCSPAGCALGGGLLRLGWGGAPPPEQPADPDFAPARSPLIRGPDRVHLTCDFGASRAASHAARGDRSAAPVLSLHLPPASPIGALRDGAWSGEAWLPFQPDAAPRRIEARDRAISTASGSLVPVIGASERDPFDLLILLGKARIRAREGRAAPGGEVKIRFNTAAEAPGGKLVLLDADKGMLWVMAGDAQSPALRTIRVPDVTRTRLTLGRRLDGDGLVLVGYSTQSGEVFAGAVDLGRAEIGPLSALGGLGMLREPCGDAKGTIRFLGEIPARVAMRGRAGVKPEERTAEITAWIEASGDRLCLRGAETSLGRPGEGELSARFGSKPIAAIRRDGDRQMGVCKIP
ncbi:MAG: hypothetical protein U0359_24825 [Byssovorax sp.]